MRSRFTQLAGGLAETHRKAQEPGIGFALDVIHADPQERRTLLIEEDRVGNLRAHDVSRLAPEPSLPLEIRGKKGFETPNAVAGENALPVALVFDIERLFSVGGCGGYA